MSFEHWLSTLFLGYDHEIQPKEKQKNPNEYAFKYDFLTFMCWVSCRLDYLCNFSPQNSWGARIHIFLCRQEHFVTLNEMTSHCLCVGKKIFTFPLHGLCWNYHSVWSDLWYILQSVLKSTNRSARINTNTCMHAHDHAQTHKHKHTHTHTHTPSFRTIDSVLNSVFFSSV